MQAPLERALLVLVRAQLDRLGPELLLLGLLEPRNLDQAEILRRNKISDGFRDPVYGVLGLQAARKIVIQHQPPY